MAKLFRLFLGQIRCQVTRGNQISNFAFSTFVDKSVNNLGTRRNTMLPKAHSIALLIFFFNKVSSVSNKNFKNSFFTYDVIQYSPFFFKFTLDCKSIFEKKSIFENIVRFAEGITWETDIFFSAHIVINRCISCSKVLTIYTALVLTINEMYVLH